MLEHTARDGDAIDNTGYIDPIVGWERTRWKALQHSQAGGHALMYCHFIYKGYFLFSLFALGLPSVKIYKSLYVRILEFLKPQHNKRQNTTDTHKANPQANH